MSSLRAAMYALEQAQLIQANAVELIRVATADSEPAPVRALLVRNTKSGARHRVFTVEGVKGWFTLERCNIDDAKQLAVIPNLADVEETSDMCGHCLPLDEDAPTDVQGVPI